MFRSKTIGKFCEKFGFEVTSAIGSDRKWPNRETYCGRKVFTTVVVVLSAIGYTSGHRAKRSTIVRRN